MAAFLLEALGFFHKSPLILLLFVIVGTFYSDCSFSVDFLQNSVLSHLMTFFLPSFWAISFVPVSHHSDLFPEL